MAWGSCTPLLAGMEVSQRGLVLPHPSSDAQVALGTWGERGSKISLLQLQEPVLQLLCLFNGNGEP